MKLISKGKYKKGRRGSKENWEGREEGITVGWNFKQSGHGRPCGEDENKSKTWRRWGQPASRYLRAEHRGKGIRWYQALRLEDTWPAPGTTRSWVGWSQGWSRKSGASGDKGSCRPLWGVQLLLWVTSHPLKCCKHQGPGSDFHFKIISVAVLLREDSRRRGRKRGLIGGRCCHPGNWIWWFRFRWWVLEIPEGRAMGAFCGVNEREEWRMTPGLEEWCQPRRGWVFGAGPWECLARGSLLQPCCRGPRGGTGIAGTLGGLCTASGSIMVLTDWSSPGFCAYSSAFPCSFFLENEPKVG